MIKLPRVIDNNGKEIKRLHPIAESISEKIVPLSYATIQVNKKEAVDERTYIELYTVNGFNGVYRTRAPQDDVVGETVTLQLEHAVSEVGDWLIQDAIDEESTVRNAFVKLFGHYRGTKWQLGSFSASESVHIDVDYDNILESLIGIIQQVPKYYMTFNFSTSPWTLSLAVKPNVITAEGRLSRNIANVIVKRDDKDLCTRVYVKGLPKPAGRADDENAIGYMDADTQALYGIVEAQTGGNDLTEAQATRVAQTFLDQHKNPKITCEVDGYDFFDATGETLDKMEIAKKYRLAIPQKSVIVEDYISAINWRDVYNAPNSVSLVIGDEQDPVIDFFKEQSSSSKSSRRSAKKQAKTNESFDQHFEQTDQYGAILLQAGMHLDEHGIIVYARDNVNNIGSILDQTATYIMGKVDSGDEDLHSEILQTQSMIRSAVWTANSEVFSYVDQTATYIQSVVQDTRNDLHSEVLQTQTMIRSAVWTANSEIVSYVDQTSTYILSVVANTTSDIGSSILQTASAIMSDVWAANSLIYTHVEQTATHIYETVVENSGAKVVASLTEPQSTEENPLKDGDIWIEGSLLHVWDDTDLVPWQNSDPQAVEYDWTQLAGTKLHVWEDDAWKLATDDTTLVEQTELVREKDRISAIAHNLEYINGEWQRNVARLDVRADRITSDVQEKVAQIGSNITQTAREIRSEVHAANSQIYSQIIQTATNIKTEVRDWVNSNFSSIEQTASSINAAVWSGQSSLYSALVMTSTNIMTEVGNSESRLRSSINQEADRIGLVVEGYGSSATVKRASLILAINNGTSSAHLDADQVYIGNQKSTTVINGKLTAEDLTADMVTTKLALATNVSVKRLTLTNNGYIVLPTGDGNVSLTGASAVDIIKNLRVQLNASTNTYTLQKVTIGDASWQDVGSFSRAISSSNWAWTNGTPQVTLIPQNQTINGNQISWVGLWDSDPRLSFNVNYLGDVTGNSSQDLWALIKSGNDPVSCFRVMASGGGTPSHSTTLYQVLEEDVDGSTSTAAYKGALYNSTGTAVYTGKYWYYTTTNIGKNKTVYWD